MSKLSRNNAVSYLHIGLGLDFRLKFTYRR